MKIIHKQNCFFSRHQWLYKLQCPLNSVPYYPLDAVTMANILKISQRTAQRICKGERELTHAELHLLQFRLFGVIDDADFLHAKLHIKNGVFYSRLNDAFSMTAGEVIEFAFLRAYYQDIAKELESTKKRLAAYENPPTVEPSNVINFYDYKKQIDKA